MAAGREAEDDFISQINVTPLVDVMLVLLIIMMVTSSAIVAKALSVNLPTAKSADSQEASAALSILVRGDGAYLLDEAPVSLSELRGKLRGLNGAQTSALVAADGDAAHRHVVALLDTLKQEGIVKLSIGVRGEGPE